MAICVKLDQRDKGDRARRPEYWQNKHYQKEIHIHITETWMVAKTKYITNCVHRYVFNQFSEEHRPTVSVDFALKAERVGADRKLVRVQLWDIAGKF